jgi:hypothetical protein
MDRKEYERLEGISDNNSKVFCSFRWVEDPPGYFTFEYPVEFDDDRDWEDIVMWLDFLGAGLPTNDLYVMMRELTLLRTFTNKWIAESINSPKSLNKDQAIEQTKTMNKSVGKYFNVIVEEFNGKLK